MTDAKWRAQRQLRAFVNSDTVSFSAKRERGRNMQSIQNVDVWLALGVVIATALTDAVYVMFTSSVIARKRVAAANWSSLWYTLSSFAVISYTNNWVYVVFAAIGSWIGAYVTMTYLHGAGGKPPAPLAPEIAPPS